MNRSVHYRSVCRCGQRPPKLPTASEKVEKLMRKRLKFCILCAVIACGPVTWYRAAKQQKRVDQQENDHLNEAFVTTALQRPMHLSPGYLHWDVLEDPRYPYSSQLDCLGTADKQWTVRSGDALTLLHYDPDRTAFFYIERVTEDHQMIHCYAKCPWTEDAFDRWWLPGVRHTNLLIDALRRQQIHEEKTNRRVSAERAQLSKLVGHEVEEP